MIKSKELLAIYGGRKMGEKDDFYKQSQESQNQYVLEKLKKIIAGKSEEFSIDEQNRLINLFKSNGLEGSKDYMIFWGEDDKLQDFQYEYMYTGFKLNGLMTLIISSRELGEDSEFACERGWTYPSWRAEDMKADIADYMLPTYDYNKEITAEELVEMIGSLNEFDVKRLGIDVTIQKNPDEPKEEHKTSEKVEQNDVEQKYKNIASSLSNEEWDELLSETRPEDVADIIDQINRDMDEPDRDIEGWDINER